MHRYNYRLYAVNLPKHPFSSPSVPTTNPGGQEQDDLIELAAVSRHMKEQLLLSQELSTT